MSLIEIRKLTKSYQRGRQVVPVLSSIDLDIREGEFVAIMGPSGSGKSTLLNLIGGLDTPTSGEVSIAGQRVCMMSPRALARWRAANVGFVFQFYNLLPSLSAQRNVEVPLLVTKLGAAERRRRAVLALSAVDMHERRSHRPGELSGGQQQRVAIARAMVSDPMVLVCDEPTGNLDRHSADEVLKLLGILNRERRKTIIMVTHDPKAAAFAERLLQIDKGVLVDERVRMTA